MKHIGACPTCLRRSWLLSLVAPYIEKAVSGATSSIVPELLRLDNEDLVEAVAPSLGLTLLARVEALPESSLYGDLRTADCWATCRHDSLYPEALREAPDAPWALIARGDKALLSDFQSGDAVTIVGARRATSYGREVARTLAHDLAEAGFTIVSGLAFG
ncbi:MAG TPA: DNA-processing protein DprA, partial [Solirubrobacterales bacterium]